MKVGDRITQLFSMPLRYQIRLPAPGREQQAEEHVAALMPHQRNGLEIVTLEVVAVRRVGEQSEREIRDERPTEPAPPMPLGDAEFLDAAREAE